MKVPSPTKFTLEDAVYELFINEPDLQEEKDQEVIYLHFQLFIKWSNITLVSTNEEN